MAEEYLRSKRIAESSWPGSRFRYTQNLESGMWACVVVEIERRGDAWVVTRLDRRREQSAKEGFETLA